MRDRSNDRRRRPAALALVAALGAALPLAGGEPPGGDLCDPGLELESDSPIAYRMRGDRCEGVYWLKVNSDDLRVESWTAWFEDYEYGDSRPLRVGWSLPPGAAGPVRLRAQALKPQTYYRMDTRLPGMGTPWAWPTDVLGGLRLGRADLGIVGWTSLPLGSGKEEPVYLPLTVGQGEAARPDGYRVVLVPGERLVEVTWSLAPGLAATGLPGAPLAGGPLGYGYYPARQPTVFTVPAPSEPGLYVLSLHADMRTGGPADRDLWFYHPGEAP
jgi:hypothetical protein